jgi:hypothetical protein
MRRALAPLAAGQLTPRCCGPPRALTPLLQFKQAAKRYLKRDPNAAEVSLLGAFAGGFTGERGGARAVLPRATGAGGRGARGRPVAPLRGDSCAWARPVPGAQTRLPV